MTKVQGAESFRYVIADLIRVFKIVDEMWGLPYTAEEFISVVSSRLNKDVFCFVDYDVSSDLRTLAVVCQSNTDAIFELFYIAPKYKLDTERIIDELTQKLNAMGMKRVFFETEKISRSYDRWMKRLGMKKFKLIYGKEL